MSGKDLLKLLRKNGWRLIRISSSHHYMCKGKKVVSVPVHASRDVPTGTLHDILSIAGLKLKR